jgi:hypothetical protein
MALGRETRSDTSGHNKVAQCKTAVPVNEDIIP